MELIEKIPIDRLKLLKRMTLDYYIKLNPDSKYKKKEQQAHYKKIMKFVEDAVSSRGEQKHLYKFSDKTPWGAGGRLISSSSVQGLDKNIRGFLFNDITTDIDIKNCHPTILKYICKLHNIDCPQLSYYIENRDTIIQRLGSDTKYLICSLINDSKRRVLNDEFLKEFYKEAKFIQTQLALVDEYQDYFKSAYDNKPNNPLGSNVNRILCYYENLCLQEIVKVVTEQGLEISTLMFDGLMVYGDHYENNKLLTDIETAINNKYKDIGIKLSYKEHSTDITDDELQALEEKEEEFPELSEHEMAEEVLKKHPHFKYCKLTLYAFDKETGLWTDNNSKHLNIIYESLKDIVGKKVLTTMKQKSVCIQITTMTIADNWLTDNANSSLGKLLFNNGYYDSTQGECGMFYTEYTPDIVFMNKIYIDLPQEVDEDYKNDVLNRFFYNPLGKDVSDYYLQNMSRNIMGHVMKRIFLCLGDGNTGKSTLTKAFIQSFGEYIGTFNAECFNHKETSQDEAQILRWALLLRFKRIIFSNELSTKGKLNGNMMKKVSSGGDAMVGRTHGKEETTFTPHFIANIFANDINEITPYDDALQLRLRVIPYTKVYVDENPNEDQLLKDPNIDIEMTTLKFKQTFIRIIMDSFINYKLNGEIQEPEAVLLARSEWVAQEANVIKTFQDTFEITNDENNYIKSAEIKDWIKENDLGISEKKFSMELKKFCKKKGFDNVCNKGKKIDGKNIQVWVGIRM
jgi:phage/plasmid-associated DNA primase